MKSKRCRFPGSRGEQLAAIIDLPEDEQPLAWAIFAHCFTCSKNLKVAVHIARALNRERIAVMRFDFAGLGESEGEFADSNFSSNVGDLIAAADYLAGQGQPPQILIGHSLGGAAVLAAAGSIASIRAVATLAAPFDPAHVAGQLGPARETILQRGEAEVALAGRHFRLRRQLLDDLSAQHPGETIAALGKPLLIMHSPHDEVVGIDHAARIYRAAKHPKSFISLDDADHLLSRAADSEYAGQLIAAWSRRYIDVPRVPGLASEVIDGRVTTRTGEGFFTELFASGHALVADEPVGQGGTGRGPSPYDYLLAALGSCTGMTLQMYARHKQWPLESVVVRLAHEKIHARDCSDCETPNGKLDRIERELDLHGELTNEQRRRLLEIAERCPVHKTLHGEVRVTTVLRRNKEEI